MGEIKKDIKNNLFILKCIYVAGKAIFPILLFKLIVDTAWVYIDANIGLWIFDRVSISPLSQTLALVIVLYVGLLLVNGFEEWLDTVVQPILSTRVTEYMSQKLIRKVFEIRQADVEKPGFYDRYSRAISEIGTRPSAVINLVRNLVTGIFQLIVLIITASKISYAFVLAFVGASLVSTCISGVINSLDYKQYEESTKVNRRLSYVNRVIYQPEFGRLLRTSLGYRDVLSDNYAFHSEKLRGVIRKFSKKICVLRVINQFVSVVFLRLTPWIIAIVGLYNQTTTVGEVLLIMGVTAYIPMICDAIFGSAVNVRKQSRYIENLRMILDYKVEKKTDKTMPDPEEPDIIETVDKVSFFYSRGEKLILDNISLNLKMGEKIAFVGPNGAGKTTLACLIAGLYAANDGRIILEGHDIDSMDRVSIEERIVMMTQESTLLRVSVAENILHRPLTCEEDYQIVEDALKKVGMYERVTSLKNGLDTIVSREFEDDGVEFSGGEQQRLAIARIFVSKAKLIIMDEPTSAVDAFSEREIIDLLFDLLKDRTIIIISHRLSIVTNMDRIMYIDHGKIEEIGTHKELLAKKGKYHHLFSVQAESYREVEL